MRKKFQIIIFFLLTFTLLLVSCNGKSSSSSSISSVSESSYTENELNSIASEFEDEISELIPSKVLEDITLITSLDGFDEFYVTWSSSNEDIISKNGQVNRPDNDIVVRLNYVIKYKDQIVKEGYVDVIVVGKEVDVYTIVLEWLYEYDFKIPSPLYFPYQVKTDVPGYNDLVIRWSTNNSPFLMVDEDYLMPRSGSNEQNVTTRAFIDINGKMVSREFTIKIPKDSDPLLPKNGLPIIHINTYGRPINSHVDYTPATFSMTRSQAYKNSDAVEEKSIGIRLRGNSTALARKKPYRIKFDIQQSLFGMGACKSWVLLAEYYDETALRNATAFYLGSRLSGLKFTPRAYHVEVYLNDVYQGIYVLTDQVQIHPSRVNITESFDVDTGYLMYWDSRAAEEPGAEKDVTYIIGITPIPFEFKTPERLTPDQRTFIGDYLKNAYDAVRLSNKTFKDIESYIDIDSAIDYIIVNEIFKTQDISAYSVYMFKDKGGKLHFGPLWDFDLSSGNVNYEDRGLPNYWFSMANNRNVWFNGLMKNNEFRVLFKERWLEIREEILPSMFDYISERRKLIYKAALANDALYPERNSDTGQFGNPPHLRGFTQYNQYTDYFYEWLNASVKFMDDEILSEEFTKPSYASRFNVNFSAGNPESPLSLLPKFL